jgi:hypothetical protein
MADATSSNIEKIRDLKIAMYEIEKEIERISLQFKQVMFSSLYFIESVTVNLFFLNLLTGKSQC